MVYSMVAFRDLFGDVTERTVLYRGTDTDIDGGIHYRNVNAFLKGGASPASRS